MAVKLLGKRLKQAFKESHFTQQDVAKELHVTKQQVSDWCRDVSFPPFLILLEIMELTHKDVHYFIEAVSEEEGTTDVPGGLTFIYQVLQEIDGK